MSKNLRPLSLKRGRLSSDTTDAPTSNEAAPTTDSHEPDLSIPPEARRARSADPDLGTDGALDAEPDLSITSVDAAPTPAATSTDDHAVSDPEAPGTASAPKAAAPETPKAEAKAAAAPAVAAEAQPAAPAPRTYEPTERLSLADGYEPTRAEVMNALRHREALDQEASAWRDAFGASEQTARQTCEVWKPIVQSLASNPEKAEYMQRCLDYFDEQAAAAGAPARTAVDPKLAELERRLRDREQADQRRTLAETQGQIERERSELQSAYPVVADPSVFREVAGRVLAMQQLGHSQYTLRDAARDMDAYLKFRSPAPAATAPAAVAAAAVPPLQGSSGAAPTGARQQFDARPRKFKTVEEAVADWERNGAPHFSS